MFDQLKGLGELLTLAQDDEKRTAIIGQVMAPVHQLAAAVAELARQQQAMRNELRETDEIIAYLHLLLTRVHAAEVSQLAGEDSTVTNEGAAHGN